MDSGTVYLVGLLWLVTYVLVLHVEVPEIDTGLPQVSEKYDARAQIKTACMAFVERVD
jgi:hypothetical protein